MTISTAKITLTQEKETMLIPLYGKAIESKRKSPILVDPHAVKMIEQVDYDFSTLKIPEKTNIMMCLRAKLIDNFTKDFLSKHRQTMALHLGCGLDSRYFRIQNSAVDWYDVDFQEVIDLKKHFFQDMNHYHMIASSVTEEEWIEKLPAGKENNLVIAEGLLMYLREPDIKLLFERLKHKLGSYTLIFDAFNSYTVKKMIKHPSLKKTGASIHWGVDDLHELENWGLGLRLLQEEYFTDNPELEHLAFPVKTMFKLANGFKMAKTAQRLLVYEVGSSAN